MRQEDPGNLPPYLWDRLPLLGLPRQGGGRHAVLVSWHVATDLGCMAGQDRMLASWSEPLLDALLEAGFRTTLLLVSHRDASHEDPLREAMRLRGIRLQMARGADPLARCMAVDSALAALAPDVVHAPERQGLLAVALSRRAAGLAHLDTTIVLHARGPALYQAEEQARFIDSPGPLLLDELERQAMRLADDVVCCNPEVARYLVEGFGDARAAIDCREVSPLAWPLPPVPAAEPCELVFPMPLGSEAGLEFAVAVLARAAARRPFPLPVTFLGQPDSVTIGNAATVLAGLAPPAPSMQAGQLPPRQPPRLDWQVQIAETPQRAMQYLARPGRVALFTARRSTPPEMLEMCGVAGIPVLATANAATEAAASRWPSIHVLPRAERSFAATLARLPAMPPRPSAGSPAPRPPLPALLDPAWRTRRALALLEDPADDGLTVFAEARPGLLAGLRAQGLPRFEIALLLPAGEPAPAGQARQRFVVGGQAGLAAALAGCQSRHALLCGDASRLRPDALLALLQAARASGAAAVAAWDSGNRPTGGGADLALLRPGTTLSNLVLLDLPALRARGGRSLAAAGTPEFAGILALESCGVLMLAEPLAEAPPSPPRPATLAPGLLPGPLLGAAPLALHFAAEAPPAALPPDAGETEWGMAQADRHSTHYLKLLGRLLDSRGMDAAAADIWRARLARDPDDGETWLRHACLHLAATDRLPDIEDMAGLVRRHGVGALGSLPDVAASHAYDLMQAGRPEAAMALLAEAAPALQDSNAYIQALARLHARMVRARMPPGLPALRPAAHAALRSALKNYALALPPPDGEGEA